MGLTALQDIVVDQEIVTQKGELVLHIGKETSNECSEMNDMGRLVFLKDGFGLSKVSVVSWSACVRRAL